MLLKRSLWNREAVGLMASALVATAPSSVMAKDKFEAGIQISEMLQFPSSSPDCQPADWSTSSAALGFINGSGLGTVIGAFTLESVDCVRSASPNFSPPFNFSSTTFKLTAANGDQIIARYSGAAELQPTGLLVLTGSFTFTSGTGKYSKVTGGGTLQGVEDISTFPATGFVSLSGTISR